MYKILIVDDEVDVVKGLEINLKSEGYQTITATDGNAGLKLAIQENPHLILLDVMLPGLSGLDFCREIRRKALQSRIIMLTAKTGEVDRVVGLEMGADDYVEKPFSLRELLARIRARLRYQSAAQRTNISQYQFGDVKVDFVSFSATKKGRALPLTSKELEVLRFLIRHQGQVVTRDELLNQVWGFDASPTTRTVDTHIFKLRKKLEPDPANPRYILSVYGGGYMFVG